MGMIDRALSLMGYERRALGSSPSWDAVALAGGGAGRVNERLAENFACVAACVGAYSGSLGSALPYVYQRRDGGRYEVPGHWLAEMVRSGPNLLQTWPEMVESLVAGILLSGNGLIEIERDGARVKALRYIPWTWTTVQIAPSGRLIYDVTEQGGIYGTAGRSRRLLADDVVHIRDRSDDGIVGRSRLSRSADTVAGALAVNDFARQFLANGASPSGAIVYDGKLSPDDKDRLRDEMRARYAGTGNAGAFMLLSDGLKFQPFSLSPEDSELLASRKFAVEEICRLYQVPPPLVQDYSNNTFTNSQAAGRWFAQFSLLPLARKIEAALTRALVPAGYEVELDLSHFQKGDPETRWAAHKIAVDAGILSADEVREIEGFNPRGAVAL